MPKTSRLMIPLIGLLAAASISPAAAPAVPAGPAALLPKPAGWEFSEEPQTYNPETLFEYINGAADGYLSYDFVELALGQYKSSGSPATMTVEIYDMATPRNAFGIYSVERYPESLFLPIGVQGYLEDGVLNFLAGRYYVKLLVYEGGGASEAGLKTFAAAILAGIGAPGAFPAPLAAFPKEGLTANTEKFILRDFLGMPFLSNGFVASYTGASGNYDAFIVEGETEEEAGAMLKAYLAHFARTRQSVVETPSGARIEDPYLATIIVERMGRFLCGVTRIKEGAEAEGEKTVAAMKRALSGI